MGFAALATAPAPELALAAVSIGELLGMRGAAAASGTPGAASCRSDVFAKLGRWRQPGLD